MPSFSMDIVKGAGLKRCPYRLRDVLIFCKDGKGGSGAYPPGEMEKTVYNPGDFC